MKMELRTFEPSEPSYKTTNILFEPKLRRNLHIKLF